MNKGYKNEFRIADYLNRRRIKDLNVDMQEMIYKLYEGVSDELVVTAFVDMNKCKYDVVLFVDRVVKRISVKTGYKNSVHTGELDSFLRFLRQCGLAEKEIQMYVRYHFADYSLDGSGVHRISAIEYRADSKHQKEIYELNKAFNDLNVVEKAIDRFVITGKKGNKPIDGLLYGTKDDFLFLTRDEVYGTIKSNRYKTSKGPHISVLQIQPFSRNLNYNPKYECNRYRVQLKWYNIIEDYYSYLCCAGLNCGDDENVISFICDSRE